jgi:hypothetical protein
MNEYGSREVDGSAFRNCSQIDHLLAAERSPKVTQKHQEHRFTANQLMNAFG